MLKFDSRNLEYKRPFGAVKTRRKVSLVFPVNVSACSTGVGMILRGEKTVRYDMEYRRTTGEYKYYTLDFTVDEPGLYRYRFEVYTPSGCIFVGRNPDGVAVAGDWLPEWQLTVYDEDFKTADWLKGGVIYHIFPDRFARVEDGKRPLYGYLKNWGEELTVVDDDGVYRANDFYGGNIKGIISRLDYIASLGVTAIYLSPIFESHSNHRYDTADYMKIDALFGTEEEFAELVKEAEKRGMGIILDGVFNHTGADSIYFNKFGHYPSLGAYQSKKSPYYKWYTFTEYPDKYTCWWGVTVVPTVRRDCAEFQKFIAGKGGVIEKWTKLGAKGWRLDVADELSTEFIEKLRVSCKSLGDIAMIGEVWEDASTKISYGEARRYLFGHELDGTMNYPFRNAIIGLLKFKNIDYFVNEVMTIVENYPKEALASSMCLLGTHDTVRILTALSGAAPGNTKTERLAYRLAPDELAKGKRLLRIASALQFFLPGLPTVYYGDEIGMQGFEDPINRRPYAYGFEDNELLAHYRYLGEIHREFSEEFSLERRGSELRLMRGRYTLVVNPIEESYDVIKNY